MFHDLYRHTGVTSNNHNREENNIA